MTKQFSAGHPGAYLRLLKKNARYRRFWSAGVVSQIGDWFNYIGIFVLLTEMTGSGQAVSWFLIAKFLPTAILGPAAGVVADRVHRKTILVVCDCFRVCIVLCYLLIVDIDDIWLIYFLAFAQETAWTFSNPARQALLPTLVSKEDLNTANGLSGASWSIMLALGAALGGLVTAFFGWHTAILIDSSTFLVSALLIATLPLPIASIRKKYGFSLGRLFGITDIIDGIRYVRANSSVAFLIIVKSGWALSGGILVMLTVFGEQVFSEGGRGGLSGVLYAMRGLGAALGPLLAWRFIGESDAAMRRSIGAAFFISCVAYLAFSQAPNIGLAAICVLFGHVGGSIQWVFSTALLHRAVDDQFRGRVFAAEMAILTLVLSLSTWVTGHALDAGMAPRTIVSFLALLFLLPGTLWLIYLRMLLADDNHSGK